MIVKKLDYFLFQTLLLEFLVIISVFLLLKLIWFQTRKKRQQNRKFFSEIDDFDQNGFIGGAVNNGKKTGVVSSGPVDRECTVNNTVSNLTTNEKTVNAQTLEKSLKDRVDREMDNIVDTVADRIQNKSLAANDIIITPRIHFAIRSINAYSGRDTGSVTASSERGQHIENTASFENVSDRINTFNELNAIDETRRNISDDVG